MRSVTTAYWRASKSPVVNWGFLCKIDHPDGVVYTWSGTDHIDYDEKEWLGLGLVAAITGIESTSKTVLSDVQIILTNVPPDVIGDADANIRGRIVDVWYVLLNQHNKVIPNPIKISEIVLDYPESKAGDDGMYTVIFHGHEGFYNLETALSRSWSDQEQKHQYPDVDDTGFSLIHTMKVKEVTWTPS